MVSKHFVETWVSLGVVDEETAKEVGTLAEEKEFIVPGQSNIIVGFSPQDTSGGGKVQKWFEDYILWTPLIAIQVAVVVGGVIGSLIGTYYLLW